MNEICVYFQSVIQPLDSRTMVLGGNVFHLQFSSLYNLMEKWVKERLKKMLLMGVTTVRNAALPECFHNRELPFQIKDGLFLLSDRSVLELYNVPVNDASQSHAH